jgi:hypothetical protein
MSRIQGWTLALLLLVSIPGLTCHKTSLHADLDQPITLRRGQWVSFTHRLPLEIAFLRVAGDSRCPVDAQCVAAGQAVVQFAGKSSEGGFDTFLATLPGGAPLDSIPWTAWSSYRVRVLKLDPYPHVGVAVDSSAFVVTFVVKES